VETLLLYITALLNFILGIVVFLANRKRPENLSLFIATIGIALWAVANAQFQDAKSSQEMYFWAVIAYQVAGFALFFPRKIAYDISNKNDPLRLLSFGLLIAILVLPLVPNFVLSGVNFHEKTIITGIGFYILFACYLFFVIDIPRQLISNIINTNKQEKQKNIIITFGILGALLSGIITNLILPASGNYSGVKFGPLFTLVLLFFVAYAILRYRAFSVRVVFGIFFYYSFTSIIPYTLFFVIAYIYIQAFGSVFATASYLTGIPVAIVFSMAFHYTDKFFKREVTTRFINPGYDPSEVVDSLNKELANRLSVKDITDSIVYVLKRTIRANFHGVIVIKTDSDTKLKHTAQFGEQLEAKKLNPHDFDNALFIWEQGVLQPIILDELEFLGSTVFKDLGNWILPLRKNMAADGVKALIPVISNQQIVGMIVIGEKEADTPFTQQDIELLTSIASSAGLSIARSFLYQEVADFNRSLQQKIDSATEQLQTQKSELEVALERLERLRQQERDMLDIMGHELRTPITIVRNALSVLKMDYDQDQQVETQKLGDYINKALESVRREIVLIETLLAATKIDANRVQLNLDKVDIIDVVQDSIEGQEAIAKERGLYINFTKPEGELSGYADRVRIQEIQDNFLNNAVKYTMTGGITISTEVITNDKGGKFVKVSIKDTGIGITQEDIQKLGRKFFRARQYIKEVEKQGSVVRPGGTGLGLYVSFELIRIMGGEVKVESKVGEGSTFSYTVPLFNNQEAKHIDQTFSEEEEELELKRSARERAEKEKDITELEQKIAEESKRLGGSEKMEPATIIPADAPTPISTPITTYAPTDTSGYLPITETPVESPDTAESATVISPDPAATPSVPVPVVITTEIAPVTPAAPVEAPTITPTDVAAPHSEIPTTSDPGLTAPPTTEAQKAKSFRESTTANDIMNKINEGREVASQITVEE
jgi:signal transduction histidine kinase